MSSEAYIQADEQDESVIGENQINDLGAIFFLMGHAKKYVWGYVLALGLLMTGAVLSIVSARYMGELVEFGLLKKNWEYSKEVAFIIVCLELSAIMSLWFGRKQITYVSSVTILNIRKHLFEKLQTNPISFYDRQPQGRIVVRITHDVEEIENFFTQSLGRLVHSLVMALVASVAMVTASLMLGIYSILSLLPVILFVYFSRNKIRGHNRKMSKYSSALNAKLAEYINGINVIRSFGLEDWSQEKYNEAVDEHYQSQLAANAYFSWSRPMISLLCSLPLIVIVFYGGLNVLAGAMSLGLFVAFVRYSERFYFPMMALAQEIHVIQQAFTNSERVAIFLKEKSEDDVFGVIPSLGHSIEGNISFDHVSMFYNSGEWVLKDVSFDIKRGERIGLVGKTGSGKTTTVSLMARLYDFQEGNILFDGHDIREFNREELRDKIGFVTQDAIIFKASLRENLNVDSKVSDEKIIASAKETGLFSVMKENSLTLDSLILEGGSNLSLGQRQLLSLTRVLLKNPSILILDEATANIDPHFEKIIQEAIEKIMVGRTCLMIAHRLNTLKSCDRLLVFLDGRLVESGPHQELMDKKGYFYKLQSTQH